MPSGVSRRELLAYGAVGGVGIGSVAVFGSRRELSGDTPPTGEGDQLQLSVDRVVRVDEATYEVTFAYRNAGDTGTESSSFVEGPASSEPPRELQAGRNAFTVTWVPDGDSDRLVWDVRLTNGESRLVATPVHRKARERWTLTLDELRAKFDQYGPSGLTVRTGQRSRRTMYLRGNQTGATFRIWEDGLVSYQDDEGWWEVDVTPEEIVPPTGGSELPGDPTEADNQYVFTMANSPYDGSQWMSTLLREGRHWGVNVFYYFPDHDRGTVGLDADQPDEVYSEISFRLGQNWEQPEGDTCKIYWAGSNLSAGPAGKGGIAPSGDDGWSVRVYTRGLDDDSVAIGSYVYHLDQQKEFGDQWEWPGEVTIGKWTRIGTYVRLNSVVDGSAEKDGVLRTYLNGTLQNERTDLRWRTTEELGFDRLGPGTYWGGTETSPRENFIYYDSYRFNVGSEGL